MKNYLSIIPITQFDSDGNFIKKWDSANKAAESLDISKAAISQCSKKFLYRKAGGYYWRNSDHIDPETMITPLKKNSVLIHQVSINGELVAVWSTLTDAAKIADTSPSNLWPAIKFERLYKGYYWKRVN